MLILANIRCAPALGEIQTYYVGPVIGAHCGPGTVAICFFGKERPC